jgi:hypothetical protein
MAADAAGYSSLARAVFVRESAWTDRTGDAHLQPPRSPGS